MLQDVRKGHEEAQMPMRENNECKRHRNSVFKVRKGEKTIHGDMNLPKRESQLSCIYLIQRLDEPKRRDEVKTIRSVRSERPRVPILL